MAHRPSVAFAAGGFSASTAGAAFALPPAARFISSPYDPEAHYAKKRATSWVGYKVHLTESCEEGTPHLITHVETTSAPATDGEVTTSIHEALAQDGLLPSTHLVDTGYVDALTLTASQRDYGVELLGPTRADYHWQAHEQKGFAASNFTIRAPRADRPWFFPR
jgi:transposase